jgi:hypothetical protein
MRFYQGAMLALVLAVPMVISSRAEAIPLVQWNVQSAGPATTNVASSLLTTGYSASGMTRGSGYTNPVATGGFWVTDVTSTSATQANSLNEFYQFSVTATGTRFLIFETLTFSDILDADGASRVALRSSVNGFASDIPLNTTVTGGAHSANLSGLVTSVGGTVTFRLYAYAAAQSTGNYALANNPVVLSGVVITPEPGSIALLSLTLPVAALARRRRK